MDFFLPDEDDPTVVATTLAKMSEAGVRPVHSVTYLHDGDRYKVTVGERRLHYPRRTGPRGGYIKDAEPIRQGRPTGGTVLLITKSTRLETRHGPPLEVWCAPPLGVWAQPSLIGVGEVEQITYFDNA